MDYLLSLEEGGGIFQASTLVFAKEEDRYQEEREVDFMEASQEERALYVLSSLLSSVI